MKVFALVAFIYFFPWSVQTSVSDFDQALGDVLDTYEAQDAINFKVTGQVTDASGETNPFVLVIQKRSSRFVVDTAKRNVDIVQQGSRGSIGRKGKASKMQRIPYSRSAHNFVPVAALRFFGEHPMFSGESVVDSDGTRLLRFEEFWPDPKFSPPLNFIPLVVVFELDAENRITTITYVDDNGLDVEQAQALRKEGALIYHYNYASSLTGFFLQPTELSMVKDSRTIFTASVTGNNKDVAIPPGYFDLQKGGGR